MKVCFKDDNRNKQCTCKKDLNEDKNFAMLVCCHKRLHLDCLRYHLKATGECPHCQRKIKSVHMI